MYSKSLRFSIRRRKLFSPMWISAEFSSQTSETNSPPNTRGSSCTVYLLSFTLKKNPRALGFFFTMVALVGTPRASCPTALFALYSLFLLHALRRRAHGDWDTHGADSWKSERPAKGTGRWANNRAWGNQGRRALERVAGDTKSFKGQAATFNSRDFCNRFFSVSLATSSVDFSHCNRFLHLSACRPNVTPQTAD